MDPRLLRYYNQELRYLREMGGEFAREFPKIAGRLGMEGLEVADPYVERLLEGDGMVLPVRQLEDEVLHGVDRPPERRQAAPDRAHEVRVRPADALQPELLRQVQCAPVLLVVGAAVELLDLLDAGDLEAARKSTRDDALLSKAPPTPA